MEPNLEKCDDEGLHFLSKVSSELNEPGNIERAYRETRAVFHTLRDLVSVVDSKDLLSQIPESIKDIYIDGWDTSKERKKIERTEEFYEEMRKHDAERAAQDFPDNIEARQAVQAVFETLTEQAGLSVLLRIKDQMPKSLGDSVSP